jgi:hypothetical protein
VTPPLWYSDGMKPQFGLRSFCLAISFVCVWMAGAVAHPILFSAMSPDPRIQAASPAQTVLSLLMLSPLWVPFVFAAYAFGRRIFDARIILALVIGEALSIGAMSAAIWYAFHPR